MSTLTRNNRPQYKDYVHFLSNYKDGKKENEVNSGEKSTDVVDFPKAAATPYNDYLNNYKQKKFNPVKPNLENKQQNKTMKSEIYIEIQNPVSEITKTFELPNKQDVIIKKESSSSISEKIRVFQGEEQTNNVTTKPLKNGTINNRIKIFQEQDQKISKSGKLSTTVQENGKKSPPLSGYNQQNGRRSPLPPPPPPAPLEKEINHEISSMPLPPPPPPVAKEINLQVSPLASELNKKESSVPLPPPPPPPMFQTTTNIRKTNQSSQYQTQTLNRSSPPKNIKTTNQPSQYQSEILDRNNPLVKKIVYGALREMYRANHDKANSLVATLPRNMVKKDSNIQNIIENIAAKGDLDKLNGRVNPKSEEL